MALLSRRALLRASAALGAGLAAGCAGEIESPAGPGASPGVLPEAEPLPAPAASPAPAPTPAPARGRWVKLSDDHRYGDLRGGPAMGNGWWKATMLPGGRILAFSFRPDAPNRGTFIFEPSLRHWVRQNENTADFWKNPGFRENYDTCYDPDRNVVWMSDGGPVGWTEPHPSLAPINTPVAGELFYDLGRDEWFTHRPTPGTPWRPQSAEARAHWDAAALGQPLLGGMDHCLSYHQGRLWKFGGWGLGPGQATRYRDVATGQNSPALDAYGVDLPPWTMTPARHTNLRSGLDHRDGTLWTLANNSALWLRDARALAPKWARVETSGEGPRTPPPSAEADSRATDFGVIAALDERAGAIVAWCGRNESVGGMGAVDIRRTWMLELSTRAWREGPSHAAGDLVPPGVSAVGQCLLYDPEAGRVVLCVAGDDDLIQVWALEV